MAGSNSRAAVGSRFVPFCSFQPFGIVWCLIAYSHSAYMPKTADSPAPASFLPLKPVEFLILMTVADSERHGYGIMLDIAERTGGAVRLEAGGLYRSIRRLLADRLVAESGKRPAADEDDERRRYYALTPLGRRVVAAEALRLRALVRDAEAIRLIDPEPA